MPTPALAPGLPSPPTRRAIVPALLAILAAAPAVRAETSRIKTDRGTFLVEVNAPGIVVRADGEELVVTHDGDEFRLRLDSERADRVAKSPILTIRRDGRVIVAARRVGADSAPLPAPVEGQKVLVPPRGPAAWGLAITPDGRSLLAGNEGTLRSWSLPDLVERFGVPTNATVRRIAVTPDGATIATAEQTWADGKTTGRVVLRDGKTGAVRRMMAPVEALHCVAIAPDGQFVVSSNWNEADLRVWDVAKGEQVGTLKGHSAAIGTVAYSPDGRALASGGDTTVRLWDVDTGAVRSVLRGHQDAVESVAFAADGKRLASGGFDDTARVWDAATGKLLATMDHDDPVLAVALSADGKSIATAAARWGNGFYGKAPAQVRVWDVATAKPTASLPAQPAQVFALAFTPDGKSLATASLSGAVTVHDLAAFAAPAPAKGPARP